MDSSSTTQRAGIVMSQLESTRYVTPAAREVQYIQEGIPLRVAPLGGKTTRQQIEHMIANNPDKESTIGERSDNHIGHGKATQLVVILEKTRIIDASNGIWSNDNFKDAYCQKNDWKNNPTNYQTSKIGKWGQGLTESSLKDGYVSKTMHNFQGTLMVTDLDRRAVEANNDFMPNRKRQPRPSSKNLSK